MPKKVGKGKDGKSGKSPRPVKRERKTSRRVAHAPSSQVASQSKRSKSGPTKGKKAKVVRAGGAKKSARPSKERPSAAAPAAPVRSGARKAGTKSAPSRADRLARSRLKRSKLATVVKSASVARKVEAGSGPSVAQEARPKAQATLAAPVRSAVPPPKKASPFPPEFLASQRERLVAKREELLERLRKGRESGLEAVDSPTEDIVDRANNAYVRELSTSLSDTERQILIEIEEALLRLNLGTYGFCAHTGRPIPRERLEVLPWAQLSVEAQERLEKGLLSEA